MDEEKILIKNVEIKWKNLIETNQASGTSPANLIKNGWKKIHIEREILIYIGKV